jgi:sterol 24-C-methyltransferase
MSPTTVQQYYARLESRIGYRLMLGGTRHFGYYAEGTLWPFPLSGAMRAMESQMLSFLSLPKGALVLDAGCGVAHVAIYMAKNGLKVEAIDIVDRHVARGRKNVQGEKLESTVTVSKMSYQDLSFSDATFDGVYTMETLSHATDFHQAVTELHRVLKPGGSLVLFEYEHADPKAGPAKEAIARVNEYSSMTTFQNLTIGSIEKELRVVGFEDIEVRDFSQNVAPMMRFFALVALIPYMLVCLLGLQERFPNTMAAVELWRHREYIKYVAISAKKEGKAH